MSPVSAHDDGVRSAVPIGEGLPRVSVPFAVARRVPLPTLWANENLAAALGTMAVLRVCLSSLVDGGDGFPRHAYPTEGLASGPVVGDQSEEWGQCLGPAARLGAGELPDGLVLAAQTAAGYGAAGARPTLGKGRSRRDLLGCSRTGVWGRQTESKALIVVAAEEDGRGIGGIRMQRIPDASADSLMPFVKESIQPGSMVHTDGWWG